MNFPVGPVAGIRHASGAAQMPKQTKCRPRNPPTQVFGQIFRQRLNFISVLYMPIKKISHFRMHLIINTAATIVRCRRIILIFFMQDFDSFRILRSVTRDNTNNN